MLIASILKTLNRLSASSSALVFRNPLHRSLSATSTVKVIEETNWNKALQHFGDEVEYFQIRRINPKAVDNYNSDILAAIPDTSAWSRYSHTLLQKRLWRKVQNKVPLVNELKQKWRRRPVTKLETQVATFLSGFMPYIDFTVISLFPYLMQSGYFVFFRPVLSNSGFGEAGTTFKMLTDRSFELNSSSFEGRVYVLFKISKDATTTKNCLSTQSSI